jgi:hypothetical protein
MNDRVPQVTFPFLFLFFFPFPFPFLLFFFFSILIFFLFLFNKKMTLEPLSMVTAVTEVVSLCHSKAKTLQRLISGVAQADRAVEAFGSEVDLLSHTLASIQIGLRNPAFTTPAPDPAVDETVGCLQNDVHWQNVTEMVDNCEDTLTRLRRIFEQVASGRSGLLLSRTARHIRLDMRSLEIMELRRQVQMYQAMMQMSLQWIGMYVRTVAGK